MLLWPAAALAAPAADTIAVNVDQAKLVKLPGKVATIVVGNPLIADVTLQTGGIVVVTGKGYGATNFIAMDRAGDILVDRVIQVEGPTDQLVTVYRGVERESYSCMPICQRRVTLGDGESYFKAAIDQAGSLTARPAAPRAGGQSAELAASRRRAAGMPCRAAMRGRRIDVPRAMPKMVKARLTQAGQLCFDPAKHFHNQFQVNLAGRKLPPRFPRIARCRRPLPHHAHSEPHCAGFAATAAARPRSNSRWSRRCSLRCCLRSSRPRSCSSQARCWRP